MIRHIVCWKLKESAHGRTKPENALLIKERLLALQADIPEILEIEVGLDVQQSNGNWDIVLNSVFESQESLDVYQHHPRHQEFKTFIMELREVRAAVDYQY